MRKTSLLILISLFAARSFSQTLPAGNNYFEEMARKNQIMGLSGDLSSFSIQPLSSAWNNNKPDSLLQTLIASRNITPNLKLFGTHAQIKILPFNWQSDYNVKRPYGYNNGSLYPSAGYQSRVSGGFYLKAGILQIQLKPEFVFAQNKQFKTFEDVQSNNNSPQLWNAYYSIINGIDAPEKFGNNTLQHLYAGQSKITVSYKNIEVGVSTENLWWGPGTQNSIMMSNSAPGFLHWTFNSAKPIKTIIGSFEWQLIGGKLDQSGYIPDTGKLIYAKGSYVPKPRVSRYISAFTINWQPKWIEGLFIGLTEYDYLNRDSVFDQKNILHKYLPVFIGSSVNANAGAIGDDQDFAEAISLRQVFSKYNTEFYFEIARNDRTGGVNDFLQEPEHSSAYTIGGRRIFELPGKQYIQIKMELTNLQRPPTYLLRDEPVWYVHLSDPKDGYTNDGRYVGAGIGPGSSSMLFDVSYLKNMNSYGIALERLVHDNDLYYEAFSGTGTYNRHWVDMSSTFYANIKFKKILLSAELTPVYTLNYEYSSGTSLNLHSRVNLTYFFN